MKKKFFGIVAALAAFFLVIAHTYAYAGDPPTDAQLYERTALAMSKMEYPDFSDVDEETVYYAFSKVWHTPSAKERWMQNLKNRISKLSDGQVKLVEGDPNKFPVRIKGPAEYQLLTKGGKSIMVIVGPYVPPVVFF